MTQFFFTLLVLFYQLAFSGPIQFGAEFVFTNQLMQEQTKKPTQIVTPESQRIMKEWSLNIESYCQDSANCRAKKGTIKGHDSIRVEFQDGFWIEISHDPVVLEVTMKKGTIEDYKKQSDRIQSFVFDTAQQMGLYVHDRIGGGHISVDYETSFQGKKLLFRNFLVDYTNHSELAWGVFGNHLGNAPPLSALARQSKEEFYQVIQGFDTNPTMTIWGLIEQIHSRVYTNNPYEKSGWVGNSHYQAIRLDRVAGSSPRIEMRGFAPQKRLEDFLLLCEMIENRILYLEKFQFPIELVMPKNEKMPPGEKLARTQSWFEEMKLDWKSYRHLMLKEIQALQPDSSLVAFHETHLSLDKTRDSYLGVDLLFSQMTPYEIRDFPERSKRIYSERYLVPYPKMISMDEMNQLRSGTEQRGRAVMAFLRDLQGPQSFLKEGRLSRQLLDRIINNNNTTWEAIRDRTSASMGFIFAPDIVRSASGGYTILEDNISANTGGLGDAWQSRKDFLQLAPQFSSLLDANRGEGFPMLAKNFLQSQSKDKAVVFIYPSSDYQYNKFYLSQLEKAGFLIVSDSSRSKYKINSKTDRVLVEKIEKGVVVERQEVGAIMMRGFSRGSFRAEYPKTFNLAMHQRVNLIGYSSFDFLDDKELSPYVEDMIEFYLKEKPILKFAQTVALSNIDQSGRNQVDEAKLNEIFDQIEKWVIKDTTGLQGKGVWIGAQLNGENKAKLKSQVKGQPGHYVAQEYIPVSRLNRWISDIRVHSVVLGEKAVASDVFWGRAVSVFDNGKLNTHQNAGVVPIFVDGRDTRPKVQVAMSELFRFQNLETVLRAYRYLSSLNDQAVDRTLNRWLSQYSDFLAKLEHTKLKELIEDNTTPESLKTLIRTNYKNILLERLTQSTSVESYMQALNEMYKYGLLDSRFFNANKIANFEKLNPRSEQRREFTRLIHHPLLRRQWERKGLIGPDSSNSCQKVLKVM